MASINIKKDGQWTSNPVLGFKVGEENLTDELREKIANGADVDLSGYATKEEVEALTAEDVGAAPAGFGLGSYAKEITGTDIDTILVGGFYWWRGSTPNTPFDWGYMIVTPANGNSYCTQTIYKMVEACEVRRTKTDAGWVTEWVNPPMTVGQEYRTTERYNGKPVYTAVVSLELGSSTTSTATLPSIPVDVVSISGTAISSEYTGIEMFPIFTLAGAVGAKVFINQNTGVVSAKTYADYSGYTATIIVKYTKE